jgi:hypothetical protein
MLTNPFPLDTYEPYIILDREYNPQIVLYYKADQNIIFKSRELLDRGSGTSSNSNIVIKRGLDSINRSIGRKGSL